MNFSFIFKMIFLSLFIFLIIYSISLVSVQNDMLSSNNFGIKNVAKESLNIGDLRVNDVVTFDDDLLLETTINNYLKNNNISIDKVRFDIAVNNDIVTVKIYTYVNMFEVDSDSVEVFSYQVVKEE
ncbi:MAG: hypothetical protein PHR25_02100 [Clostridia bacterium]|nr:hypothetical protein [Clostridia bacterium]